ncbi:Phage terminase-like protein, large subunit, contains N-terminal HTH domain [[Luteovulum] sphaeroides subsp. megalophilum]|uniref:terminase large subunit n=1 Tax=Cereibacter sphaeroides TaxID=1063 RepID=UPI000B656D9F|nr:terminase large subunit [Cereibacter sphaeroides]SNT17264.1 Phage terminase-like protein, large subunit, contains N-terminal HTH domain [[Luteovulum] sphaeroides subsp. megalophilum]
MIHANDWSTACPDWAERLAAGRSLIPDLPLFRPVADKALRIFKSLRVPDMIGTPTLGEVCEEWIFDLVRAIFGAYDPETRRRMIRQFFVMIPKKNGKSSIAAAIIVTAVILNERPLAEAILIAETQKIADIAFRQAAGIIRLDARLDKEKGGIFDVKDHSKTIVHMNTGAVIRILSADGDVITGSKAAYILVDETHVLGHKSKADAIYLELEGGLAARPEGFLLEITTQSKVQPHGEFKRRLKLARDVRDGKVSLPILPVLYEMPAKMQAAKAWMDDSTWGLVNPNLERSVSIDFLREKFVEAQEGGDDKLALFASQHLNVEMGIGLHSDRWVGADYWLKNAEPGLTYAQLLDQCEVVIFGGDVGGADDLFGLTAVGRHRETKIWLTRSWAWCVRDVLKNRKEIAPRLEELERAGDLRITDGAAEHVEEAVAIICEARDAGRLPDGVCIGLDPYGVAALVDALEAEGFDPSTRIAPIGQGYKLNGAVKGLERRLLDGRIRHAGQQMMTWCVGNAKAEQRGNNVYITKEAAGVAKIDPLIALFTGAVLMDTNPQAPASLDDFLSDPVMVI